MRKTPTLKKVKEEIDWKKRPQWAELERKADRVIEMEREVFHLRRVVRDCSQATA